MGDLRAPPLAAAHPERLGRTQARDLELRPDRKPPTRAYRAEARLTGLTSLDRRAVRAAAVVDERHEAAGLRVGQHLERVGVARAGLDQAARERPRSGVAGHELEAQRQRRGRPEGDL